MKKLMVVTQRRVMQTQSLKPGDMVDVQHRGVGSQFNAFIVQSVARLDIPGEFLVVMTKKSETLLMKVNSMTGTVELNYVSGSVTSRDFVHMQVWKAGNKRVSVDSTLSYESEVNTNVNEPVVVGTELTSGDNRLVVEYVCQDGSIVFQSTRVRDSQGKDKEYPTKTIIIGEKNRDFWKAINQKTEWKDA